MQQTVERKLIYDGRPEVHSDGNIFRFKNGERVPAALNGIGRNKNYMATTLCFNGKQKSFYAHCLVAEAFIPNPENKPDINHKDGNPKNNSVDNLEWCTKSENTIHALENGLIDPMANANPCAECGNLTRAKNMICPKCKLNIKRAKRRDKMIARRKDDIEDALINRASEQQKQVYRLRLKGKTYQEIADILGVSRQRVGQIILTLKGRNYVERGGNKFPVLARIMYEKGITQQDVAAAINITQCSVSKKMRGSIEWRLSEAREIRDFLQVDMPIEELFSEKEAILV